MCEEIKITKEDLALWLDRPPSNDDLDLCSYLSNAVENQHKYYQENQQLKDNWNKLKEWLKEGFDYERGVVSEEFIEAIENTLDKMQEIEGGMNESQR